MEEARDWDTTALLRATALENPGVVLVQLTATWCGPCAQIAPFLQDHIAWIRRLDPQSRSARCVRVDVDANPRVYADLKSQRVVRGVPAFLLYARKDAAALAALTRRQALFPEDAVLGANALALDSLIRTRLLPAIPMGLRPRLDRARDDDDDEVFSTYNP